MIYKTIVARINGQPDSVGEVLGSNFTLPPNPVRVTHENYENVIVGSAHIEQEGDNLVAYIDLNDDVVSLEVAKQCYGTISGKVIERVENRIEKWALKSVSVSGSACDKTLPKLQPSNSTGCCFYSGPPFVKCYKCGSRNSV